MGFIIAKAIKPPQTPLNPKQKVIQPHTKTSPAQLMPGKGLAWACPCLALPALPHGQITKPCGMAIWPGRTLAFTMQLKRWG